jgi:hypothetical protein
MSFIVDQEIKISRQAQKKIDIIEALGYTVSIEICEGSRNRCSGNCGPNKRVIKAKPNYGDTLSVSLASKVSTTLTSHLEYFISGFEGFPALKSVVPEMVIEPTKPDYDPNYTIEDFWKAMEGG